MGNNKELYNPCETCILLVKCIQKYKNDNYYDPYTMLWSSFEKDSCDILFKAIIEKDEITGYFEFNENNKYIEKWWKDNYG